MLTISREMDNRPRWRLKLMNIEWMRATLKSRTLDLIELKEIRSSRDGVVCFVILMINLVVTQRRDSRRAETRCRQIRREWFGSLIKIEFDYAILVFTNPFREASSWQVQTEIIGTKIRDLIFFPSDFRLAMLYSITLSIVALSLWAKHEFRLASLCWLASLQKNWVIPITFACNSWLPNKNINLHKYLPLIAWEDQTQIKYNSSQYKQNPRSISLMQYVF